MKQLYKEAWCSLYQSKTQLGHNIEGFKRYIGLKFISFMSCHGVFQPKKGRSIKLLYKLSNMSTFILLWQRLKSKLQIPSDPLIARGNTGIVYIQLLQSIFLWQPILWKHVLFHQELQPEKHIFQMKNGTETLGSVH